MAHDFKRFPELANSQMQFYFWDSPHKQILENFTATVTRVKDGDTVQLKWDERDFEFPLRMLGIDAPELDEGGKASKDWLTSMVEGKEVEIKINPRQRVGKWGRILGDIVFGGESMTEASLREGHSIPFERETNPWL